MVDGRTLLDRTRLISSSVRGTLRRDNGRPRCPRCGTTRAVQLTGLSLAELAGHYDVEERDWRCQDCSVVIRESATLPAGVR